MNTFGPCRTWPIVEAEARISEILRRAEEEGPQRIDAGSTFIVVPERLWRRDYGDKRAVPVSGRQFANVSDPWQTLENFMRFYSVVESPVIRRGLFT